MSRDDAFIKRRDTVLSPGKVTVIVITWNSLQYVKQTFPALLKQQYRSIEYVIVDNGSIDGTVEFFKNEIDKSSEKQITLIENKENQGISIAKNQGVRHSSGDYVLLLDDDILIQNHHFIANIVDYYSKLPDPAFLMPFFLDSEELESGFTETYGTYYFLFGLRKKKRKIHFQNIIRFKDRIPIAVAQGGAMFIRKAVWDELGGFDESQKFNLDDDDISTRALVFGYHNYLYNREYIIHLGLSKRRDPRRYAWNDRTYYCGKSKAILKNFDTFTSIWMLFFFSCRAFVEAVYHSFTLRYAGVFAANLYSVFLFIKDLPDTLRKRRAVQAKRKCPDSYILKLNRPDF